MLNPTRILASVSVGFGLAFGSGLLLAWIDSPPIGFYLLGAVVVVGSLYQAVAPTLLKRRVSKFGARSYRAAAKKIATMPLGYSLDFPIRYSMEMDAELEAARHRRSWLFAIRPIIYTTLLAIAVAISVGGLVLAARSISLDNLLLAFEIFLFVVWIWILITILTDLFHDHETSRWAKSAWALFLIFIPFLTALAYLIARGSGMRERAIKAQAESKHMNAYIREQAHSSPADELHKLNDLKEKGAISTDEFEKAKSKYFSSEN